ncbi:MAG: tRNA pseudouridine(38-40) synthase TruA [Microbacter sp.]
MEQRYFFWISYNGTAFHGWQSQPNGNSVQSEMEQALKTLYRKPVCVIGAGRTDAGVHAKEMVAHADLPMIDNEAKLMLQLNGILPSTISVNRIQKVRSDAHARFDAVSRTYEYWIVTHKNPFVSQLAAAFYFPLDFHAMNQAATVLNEYSDFTSFSKLHTDVKTNDCQVMDAHWEQRNEFWVFTITANRFLRNMVRSIVGTLLLVGRGMLTTDDFRAVIEAKDRRKAGSSVNPSGLYLIRVTYPPSVFID